MALQWLDVRGQPAIDLRTPWGDQATVLLHGAQLVSWQTSDGREHLYLSPQARLNGQDAVRGGVPVCFPQFNQRGPLMKHGFARHLPWQVREETHEPDTVRLRLVLTDGAVTRQFWPHAFELALEVNLSPNALRLGLQVDNTDAKPWSFTTALHTYLQVPDVTQMALLGLEGAQVWDAVHDVHGQQSGPVRFGAELDSVFQAQAGQSLRLVQAPKDGSTNASAGSLSISQSASCLQTVVWNPGEALCRTLGDMPTDGWQHMLCVEAASIDAPITLQPEQSWQAWQAFHWSA